MLKDENEKKKSKFKKDLKNEQNQPMLTFKIITLVMSPRPIL